ncbi:MAG: cyclic nucleotide-binding domain-containing protein [Bdellovibrionales bacterium]|nr:cyclic nucleotide-binding domain-containing protein [Bdellovibrionales bacterium]
MSSSYEKELKETDVKDDNLTKKLDFGVMKYLWMANPLSRVRRDSIPRFLRNVELLKNFSDNELRLLSKYMHSRKFSEGDVIFRENEIGIGFYFIFSGLIELSKADFGHEVGEEKFLILDEFSYFGEMALLQDGNPRSATAIAKSPCELVGIFKPDLEHLIEKHPTIAAKLIQSISLALADRLYYLTEEASKLSRRLRKVERQLAEQAEKK